METSISEGGNMNWDEIKGNWKDLKGKAKQQWGELTDDELLEVEGDKDRLVGTLQKHYGRTKEEISREIDEATTGW
jgi:uncharacterized protein YjbJ (UPF0337 family)